MPPLFIKSRDMCVGFYTSKGILCARKADAQNPAPDMSELLLGMSSSITSVVVIEVRIRLRLHPYRSRQRTS